MIRRLVNSQVVWDVAMFFAQQAGLDIVFQNESCFKNVVINDIKYHVCIMKGAELEKYSEDVVMNKIESVS